MKFDLEIQPGTVALRFINGGDTISSSYIPALYLNTKEVNIDPSDFVALSLSTELDSSFYLSANQVNLTSATFDVYSDQILVTHIAKYSKLTGAKYPIFYKHVITISDNERLIDQSVTIYNENGVILDSELYLVETYNNQAYIYINPSEDTVLTVEWSDSSAVHKECLKLVPVFTDMGPDFYLGTPLGRDEFYITSSGSKFICHTSRLSGVLFYISKESFDFIKKPVANINEPWYLQINNIVIKALDHNGTNIYYRLPEYYLQKMSDAQNDVNYDSVFKKYTNQLCEILDGKYIRTQMAPSISKLSEVNIYIYNKQTKVLEYAYTTNSSLYGKTVDSSGILWIAVQDYSYNGIFILNIEFDSAKYIAYADYSIDNIYYEFRYLDLNSIEISKAKLIALYLAPDTDASIYSTRLFYVFIGTDDGKDNYYRYERQGVSFGSIQQYETFIADFECMHMAYVSVETDKLNDILDITYCANSDTIVYNENQISKTDLDLVYGKLINREFSVQLDDTAFIYVNPTIYEDESTSTNLELSISKNDEYMDFISKTVNENITVSTKTIVGRNIINSNI